MRRFARLEAAVHDSKHFSPEILENLQDLSTPTPPLLAVEGAISGIAEITKQTMEHANATGDNRAKEMLSDLLLELSGVGHTRPYRVVTLLGRNR